MEYMHQPIRFNAVAPGGMRTMLAAGMLKLTDADPALVKRYSPLRGLVEIDDVAEMVAFLASDAARGYHGAIINLDNGITAGRARSEKSVIAKPSSRRGDPDTLPPGRTSGWQIGRAHV